MAEIVERYFYSLKNRLNEETGSEYEDEYIELMTEITDICKEEENEELILEKQKSVIDFFKRLLICSMAPHQDEILEDIEKNIKVWIMNLKESKGTYCLTSGNDLNSYLTPSRRQLLFELWKKRKIEIEEKKRKAGELDALYALLNAEKDLYIRKYKSINRPYVKNAQTGKLERRTHYIHCDLCYLIDQLNIRISKASERKSPFSAPTK